MTFDCSVGFTEDHSDELRRRLREMERAFNRPERSYYVPRVWLGDGVAGVC